MTSTINVYRVPGSFLAVKTHDSQYCLKCKHKTKPVLVFDQARVAPHYRFKIRSQKIVMVKSNCSICNTVRRNFCKYVQYSTITDYPYQQNRNFVVNFKRKYRRYVESTWVSKPVVSINVSWEEMHEIQAWYKVEKPMLKRTRLPRKYPHNRTQPYPPSRPYPSTPPQSQPPYPHHPYQPPTDPTTADIRNLVGDDYVRAIRAQRHQGQWVNPQGTEQQPYPPADRPDGRTDENYYNYRNNLVETSEEVE